ncbi:MAG TPA: 4Fe-4S binding protein [Clostridiaceae bacterium]|nr:4Fe-4S binding protein [Clostridiaceae bacterium]
MRGIFTPVTKIRREIFAQVARFAYERNPVETAHQEYYDIPFRISPGETPQYRDSVFIERAVARERVRLAMGMDLRPIDNYVDLAAGFEDVNKDEKIMAMPIVNVISFACQACPTKTYRVSSNCRRCIAHPCTSVCPKKCITIGPKGAIIDEEACIRCGRCQDACPYNAILCFDRPCAEVCGADAIGSDELGRAVIDPEACVSCGLCMANCPFGAIADKSEIFQIINAIRSGQRVVAAIAPAFVGQFGPLATPARVFNGIKALGFTDVVEVAVGADMSSMHEAKEFIELVPDKQPFLGTSCCTAWEAFARKVLPDDMTSYISTSSTPMVATAEVIKKNYPDAKVVFIGPCVAKKVESLEAGVRPYIDFVLTFEELMGMFVAKHVELSEMDETFDSPLASKEARNYAVASSVAPAIVTCIKELAPERGDVPYQHADTLADCKKMLLLAQRGKLDGHLLEGMACPGGCIGGAGTLAPLRQATRAVQKYADESEYTSAVDNPLTHPNEK